MVVWINGATGRNHDVIAYFDRRHICVNLAPRVYTRFIADNQAATSTGFDDRIPVNANIISNTYRSTRLPLKQYGALVDEHPLSQRKISVVYGNLTLGERVFIDE